MKERWSKRDEGGATGGGCRKPRHSHTGTWAVNAALVRMPQGAYCVTLGGHSPSRPRSPWWENLSFAERLEGALQIKNARNKESARATPLRAGSTGVEIFMAFVGLAYAYRIDETHPGATKKNNSHVTAKVELHLTNC